jgi:hypothetical protein
VAGSCEHCNEPSDSVKSGRFLYQLIDYQRLKVSAPENCNSYQQMRVVNIFRWFLMTLYRLQMLFGDK